MGVLHAQLKQTNQSQEANSLFRCKRKQHAKTSPFTYTIRDHAAIGNSSSGVVKEGLPIWPEICPIISGGIDKVIISRIKK